MGFVDFLTVRVGDFVDSEGCGVGFLRWAVFLSGCGLGFGLLRGILRGLSRGIEGNGHGWWDEGEKFLG